MYKRQEEQNSSEHVQAITVDFLADDWTTQDCRQEQMTDEEIGLILTAKEKGCRLDWQDICHGSEVLKSYGAQWESLTLENGLLKSAWESADGRDVVMQ